MRSTLACWTLKFIDCYFAAFVVIDCGSYDVMLDVWTSSFLEASSANLPEIAASPTSRISGQLAFEAPLILESI